MPAGDPLRSPVVTGMVAPTRHCLPEARGSSKIDASFLENFIRRHGLPADFARTATRFYRPLAEWLHRCVEDRGQGGFVLGINGAQGAGKSTLAAFLAGYLQAVFDQRVASFSIDDLYLPRAERQALARRVHPLLATRGVPGIHDPALGCRLIEKLQALRPGETLPLPRFDKLADERLPPAAWPVVEGPVDVILFEGWCVGSQPVPAENLAEAINDLERRRDAGGEWRRYVNEQLGTRYQALFALLDALVFLAVPDFACVRRWRTEQEARLVAADGGADRRGMDAAQVAGFVQYFERISRDNLALLPQSADVVLRLGQDHQVVSAAYRES